MSRREDPRSEYNRHRSRLDREPSPKRSRRDGKPETGRPPTEPNLDKERTDRDHRQHRRLQDPLPLESGTVNKEFEKGVDPTKISQPRSYFQHDNRAGAGQNGRSFSRRIDSERGWWRDYRSINKIVSVDAQQKGENAKDNKEGSHVWRQDGYFEMEANPKLPARKRPAFREQKIPANPDRINKTVDDLVMPNPQHHAVDSWKRNERGYESRYSHRPERPVAGDRELNRAQSWRGNFSSIDRSSTNSRYRGLDRFPAKEGCHPTGGRVEKWKHDLYDEANRSPPPKNEEDQISKIEALLSS